MNPFSHSHNGKSYTVAVRLCPDGFVDGATRAAVAHAFAGVANHRDLLGDVRNADALYDLIFEVRDDAGAPVSRPWPTWMRDFSASKLDEAATFFFEDLKKKMSASPSFEASTRQKEMTDLILMTLTLSRTPTPSDPQT